MDNVNEKNDTRYIAALSLGALGVVYGDIGTSPLYGLRECFAGSHKVDINEPNVLGVLSLIFWSLIIIISIKYLVFIVRADNRGEGGILALMALIRTERQRRWFLVALGLFGASLLYGDGMISPAMAVLSAVEGLNVATNRFEHYVVPITVGILVGLFLLQRRGTGGLGKLFGPIMIVWFSTMAILGVRWIVTEPHVLAAVNPWYAVTFFVRNGFMGFLVLGSVFLVVTGGESLYADMGHFGRRPIRIAWFCVVLPSLLLNYFGQGALLLQNQENPKVAAEVAEHVFYRLAPQSPWFLYPFVGLATIATIIASQAVISGAFSLTRQAVQLGYSPRVEIVHTSEAEIGQIYVPAVNWILMIATIGLVLGFQSSTKVAAAYGMAVTTTMVLTTLLAYVVARELWGWSRLRAGLLMGALLFVDVAFFLANTTKIPQGGWFPLVVASIIYLLMVTWKQGRRLLAERIGEGLLPVEDFVRNLQPGSPTRVPGTAVFLVTDLQGTPTTLLHNLKHNKVLHEQIVLMTVVTEEVPRVPRRDRVDIEPLDKGFFKVTAHYGFTQDPRAADVLEALRDKGLNLDLMKTTFFLGRDTLIPTDRGGMNLWRKRLFGVMSRNAVRFNDFFHIPPNRVVELGMQVRL